jgi:cell division protein FtsQ
MKSKVRNQRVSSSRHRRQQHLLEVTLRHDKAVAIRNRTIFMFCCKMVLWTSVVSGVCFGGREAFRRFFWENPDLFLKEIRVSTDGSLTREQLLLHAELSEGRNIFSVDPTLVRSRIALLPQVERVEVQRILPDRLEIGVTERKPVAWAIGRQDEDPTSSERAFLIDVRGVVMRSKSLRPDYLHLPVISGVEVENLAPGQRVQSLEMQAALELIRLNADSTRFQARNIDLSKGYCLVVTDRTRAKVLFGLDRIDLQLEKLNRLLDHVQPSKREVQMVNLLLERNLPVTFVEEPAPEAAPVAAVASAASGSTREKPAVKGPGAKVVASVKSISAPASGVVSFPQSSRVQPTSVGVRTGGGGDLTLKGSVIAKPVPALKAAGAGIPAGVIKKPFNL